VPNPEPTFTNLIESTPYRYSWQTPQAIEKARKNRERTIPAYMVKDDTRIRLVPEGFCNWCGKPLTGRSKFFCPQAERDIGHTKLKRYWCTDEFMAWWCSVPKFKRAIFKRDSFTCQACGAKPEATNKYGLVIPDLSLLRCDHIHPFAHGGKTEKSNLQTLCHKCNSAKSDKIGWQPSVKGRLL